MSHEYVLAIALLIGAIAKFFGYDIDNKATEAGIVGIAALWIAIRRKQRGDISVIGVRK